MKRYPASPFASKAQYAVGWIYEQLTVQPDSAIASYEKLLSLYPGSTYAVRVQPKLAEVQLKRNGGARAVKDSAGTGSSLLKQKKQDVIDDEDQQEKLEKKRVRKPGDTPARQEPPPGGAAEERPKP